ncbi:peptidase inhibitor family I36 protein [Streptomyces mutabilis]|uniref:Peptidase inhibitor family I36 n=1 Tax=Streptomyces mutabilis TaxID=67332 RepID=A0A086N0U0_9ACTN|nr:peptidase inhibitor family I36 protein [Streptomyces mutabilis]KFG74758.1 hypothetical protein FM21_00905 [Streptomyces mutabilis]
MRNRFTRTVSALAGPALAGPALAGSGLAVVNAAPAAARMEDCPKGYFCGWTGKDADGSMWKTNESVADLGERADDIHSYTNRTASVACLYGKRNHHEPSFLRPEAYALYGDITSIIRSIKFVQDEHECNMPDYPGWAASPTSASPAT